MIWHTTTYVLSDFGSENGNFDYVVPYLPTSSCQLSLETPPTVKWNWDIFFTFFWPLQNTWTLKIQLYFCQLVTLPKIGCLSASMLGQDEDRSRSIEWWSLCCGWFSSFGDSRRVFPAVPTGRELRCGKVLELLHRSKLRLRLRLELVHRAVWYFSKLTDFQVCISSKLM